MEALSYMLLGFVISATMFQLSCSLALVLNIIDIKEAKRRRFTYNMSVIVLSIVCIFGTVYELSCNRTD